MVICCLRILYSVYRPLLLCNMVLWGLLQATKLSHHCSLYAWVEFLTARRLTLWHFFSYTVAPFWVYSPHTCVTIISGSSAHTVFVPALYLVGIFSRGLSICWTLLLSLSVKKKKQIWKQTLFALAFYDVGSCTGLLSGLLGFYYMSTFYYCPNDMNSNLFPAAILAMLHLVCLSVEPRDLNKTQKELTCCRLSKLTRLPWRLISRSLRPRKRSCASLTSTQSPVALIVPGTSVSSWSRRHTRSSPPATSKDVGMRYVNYHKIFSCSIVAVRGSYL